MCIYGDPAYPMRARLIRPFRDRVSTPKMQAFNRSMSQVREAVEWLFNDVAKSWNSGELRHGPNSVFGQAAKTLRKRKESGN